MWSVTSIPKILPASTNLFVKAISSSEGVGSPEGWLWTKITATANSLMAGSKTSRGWTKLELIVPIEIVSFVINLFLASKYKTTKFSFLFSLRWLVCFRTSFGE